jgi:hypothetical protein
MEEIQKMQLEFSKGMIELRASQVESDKKREKSNEEFDKRMKQVQIEL